MNEPVCIFCKKNSLDGEDHILTDEHIIPQVIGGWLTIPYVCKKCNNLTFGSKFEAELKGNGYIVSALDKLNIKPKKEAYRAADLRLLFPSKEENQTNYNEVFQFRRLFIINNSNVSVNFTEININIDEFTATVSLKVNIRTDQMVNEWEEIDTLQKRNGKWEIVSWNRLESR